MSFDALGLTPELLRAVADQGYTEPTPVQREAIPVVLAGRDLLAGAQTGTGKTAAFVLPILQLLNGTRTPGWQEGTRAAATATGPDRGASATGAARRDPGPTGAARRDPALTVGDRRGAAKGGRDRGDATRPPIRTLVLTPTRELALQVEESVRTYGAHRRIRSVAIYGGVGFEPQVRALRAGPGIVVATPGRLLDHAGQGTIDLSRVEILVLDEADRMLDMGFIRDIRRIIGLLPTDRQNLMFSATFSDDIRTLAGGILRNPATVQVTPRNTPTALVTQLVIPVDRERKRDLLSQLIRSGRIEQALVFTRTKHGANRLAEQLARDGIRATAIHGNKSQGQRVRALDDFKAGRANILVATEVASRGLDIEELPHVINYELPMVAEDYVHRIGRTGRAGATGDAISLVCVDEAPLLRDIEKLLHRPIPTEVIPGFEPDRSIRPEPIRQRSQGGARGESRPGEFRLGSRPATRPAGEFGPRPSFHPAHGEAVRRHPAQRPDRPAPNRPAHLDRRGPAPTIGSGIGNGSYGRPAAAAHGGGPRPHGSGPRPRGVEPRPYGPARGDRGHVPGGRPPVSPQRSGAPRPAQHRPGERPFQPAEIRPVDRHFAVLPGERLSRGGKAD